MKIKCTLLLLLSLTFNLHTYAQSSNPDLSSYLKGFYMYYINETFENIPPKTAFSEDTLRKYCTAAFLKKLKSDTELDVDPITHGQDVDKEWKKTLYVKKATDGKPQHYKVCMYWEYYKKDKCVDVYLKKEDGIWKIARTCDGKYCY